MKTLLLLALFLTGAAAHAEYSFSCGKNRDLGAKKAETALWQDPDSLAMKMLFVGKELGADEFKVTGRAGGFYVSVFGKGDSLVRYEFTEKPAQVKVFKVAGKKETPAGTFPCKITDTSEAADAPQAP